MNSFRQDHELPLCCEKWGWKFHHLGIPTDNKLPGEKYLKEKKFYVSGFKTGFFGVEWMRFEKGSRVHPLIRQVPHLAFMVNDIEHEIAYRKLKVISPPESSAPGIRVAMIEDNGAPIELIEFK